MSKANPSLVKLKQNVAGLRQEFARLSSEGDRLRKPQEAGNLLQGVTHPARQRSDPAGQAGRERLQLRPPEPADRQRSGPGQRPGQGAGQDNPGRDRQHQPEGE
ncbi:hypothetical protein G6F35_017394 [Rhizopus arrhizus]|nr:hypothetical protein G6F35_017394 [Rhizopus arrhizus]